MQRVFRRSLTPALLAFCCAIARGEDVAIVGQATVFRSKGTVQAVVKGGAARDAYATKSGPPGSAAATPKPATKQGAAKPTTNAYLQPGETLRTGADGEADVALPGRGSVRLMPNSELRLPDAKSPGSASLEVLRGKLFFDIEPIHGATREFRLKTPQAILAVKGTQFFVNSATDGDTIGVHRGAVSVSRVGRAIDLNAGNAATSTPAALTDARAMTDEEKKMGDGYKDLGLVRVPYNPLKGAQKSDLELVCRPFLWSCIERPASGGNPGLLESRWEIGGMEVVMPKWESPPIKMGGSFKRLNPEPKRTNVGGFVFEMWGSEVGEAVAVEFTLSATKASMWEIGPTDAKMGARLAPTNKPTGILEHKNPALALVKSQAGGSVVRLEANRPQRVQVEWTATGLSRQSFWVLTRPGDPKRADMEFKIEDIAIVERPH